MLAALKRALQSVVDAASIDEQLALLRAHPELAGKAAIAGALTAESTSEQASSGLDRCTPHEYAQLHALNADYNGRFGFPFILAVKGPTGQGLSRQAIIATFERRIGNARGDELREALRQVHRIAEIRLNALLGVTPSLGARVMDWCETLGAISDVETNLTCAYMTPAHQRTAACIAGWMRAAGMTVHIDAQKPWRPVRTTTPCAMAASTTGAWASCCRSPSSPTCTRAPSAFRTTWR
jgi:N-carbamoyl-L-amino-acid hydrolase